MPTQEDQSNTSSKDNKEIEPDTKRIELTQARDRHPEDPGPS